MEKRKLRNTPGGTHGAENSGYSDAGGPEICAFRALKSVSVECGAAALERAVRMPCSRRIRKPGPLSAARVGHNRRNLARMEKNPSHGSSGDHPLRKPKASRLPAELRSQEGLEVAGSWGKHFLRPDQGLAQDTVALSTGARLPPDAGEPSPDAKEETLGVENTEVRGARLTPSHMRRGTDSAAEKTPRSEHQGLCPTATA
ncbi:hypothetical protein MJT46_012658 [Ovis ammon polii x Ovis aries]|nr:hypothetical protein MJT46_012658 [Ovis ammon polii x Ovis aries]